MERGRAQRHNVCLELSLLPVLEERDGQNASVHDRVPKWVGCDSVVKVVDILLNAFLSLVKGIYETSVSIYLDLVNGCIPLAFLPSSAVDILLG